MKDYQPFTRRAFVKTASAALGAVTIVPRHVLGGPGFVPPSDQLALAFIGVGSQGLRVMTEFLALPTVRAVTMSDVNQGSADFVEWGEGELRRRGQELLKDPGWGEPGAWAGLRPAQDIAQRHHARQLNQPGYKVTAYEDYRHLLDREKDVDAVVIGTPDHLHAKIAVDAMRAGKHVFSQKPMAHTVHEAKRMADVARETGLATQVATGNTASEATRRLTEWVADGAIGPVREVHNWSSRPFWPQGIERPKEAQPVPAHLNWDLWLGPAAHRPYHAAYQPFIWRGWHDFGTGALGDMGCYSFDTIFRVLKLGPPERIEASSSGRTSESYPTASLVHFFFGARDGMPPVTLHWYDGGLKPQKPEEMGAEEMPAEGLLFVGDKGKILAEFTGGEARLIPEAAMRAYVQPPKTLPRSIGHYEEWIAAAKGEPVVPGANFQTVQPITDAILLGNIALRTGAALQWNPNTRLLAGSAEANDLLAMPSRDGWAV